MSKLMSPEMREQILGYIMSMDDGKCFYTKSLSYRLKRDLNLEVSAQTLKHLLPTVDCVVIEHQSHNRVLWKVVL